MVWLACEEFPPCCIVPKGWLPVTGHSCPPVPLQAEKLRQQKAAQEAALGLAPMPQPAAKGEQQQGSVGGEEPPAKRAKTAELS